MTNGKQLPAKADGQLQLSSVQKQGASSMQIASLEHAKEVGRILAAAKGGNAEAQNTILILAGVEMGISPVAATQGLYIHSRSGQVQQKAELIKNEISKHPKYDYKVLELNDERCKVQFFVDGKPAPGKEQGIVDWDIPRARLAGLLDGPNKDTYAKWPRNMLFKQCMQDGARFHCPGLFNGYPIVTDAEADAMETNPVENIAQGLAEERAQKEKEVSEAQDTEVVQESEPEPPPKPTFNEVLEAQAIVAEALGDTETAEKKRDLQKVGAGAVAPLMMHAQKNGFSPVAVNQYVKENYNDRKVADLTDDEYEKVKARFTKQ